ncbi:MAG: hypothetical protein HQK76_18700 [Desulfobacterales bacterium]|nr:hypothetical protein [Desulfobacterales bacterium]
MGRVSKNNVHEYAPVGCLENTMVGNDRSGTVDNNLDLLKAVELALSNGKELIEYRDQITNKIDNNVKLEAPNTGDPNLFKTWEKFWDAYSAQTKYIIKKCVETYETSESIRAKFSPTPYLSCLVESKYFI